MTRIGSLRSGLTETISKSLTVPSVFGSKLTVAKFESVWLSRRPDARKNCRTRFSSEAFGDEHALRAATARTMDASKYTLVFGRNIPASCFFRTHAVKVRRRACRQT